MRRRESGLTLVELLVASAVLVLLLTALGSLYVSSRRAYEVNRTVTSASGQLRSAVEALQYDLSLAGYCADPDACGLGGSPFEVNTDLQEHLRVVTSVTARYQETRYTAGGAPESMAVTFRVVDGKLVREVGGESETIADGVLRLVLLGYRSRDDVAAGRQYSAPGGDSLTGVDLRLDYVQGGAELSQEFTVPIRNAI